MAESRKRSFKEFQEDQEDQLQEGQLFDELYQEGFLDGVQFSKQDMEPYQFERRSEEAQSAAPKDIHRDTCDGRTDEPLPEEQRNKPSQTLQNNTVPQPTALLSEKLSPRKEAIKLFNNYKLATQKEYVKRLIQVFDPYMTIFRYKGPNEINIQIPATRYVYQKGFLNTLAIIFPIINPEMGPEFQVKQPGYNVVDPQAEWNNIVLQYPEGFSENKLKEMLGRFFGVEQFAINKRYSGGNNQIIACIQKLNPNEDLIQKIIESAQLPNRDLFQCNVVIETQNTPNNSELPQIPLAEEILDLPFDSDERAALLKEYQPLLLDPDTARSNQDAIKIFCKLDDDDCIQNLSVLLLSFDKDQLIFHQFDSQNKIGIEVKNNGSIDQVKWPVKKAAKLLIPLITNKNDISIDVQANYTKLILELTFNHSLSPEELQNIVGRFVLIQQMIKKKLLERQYVVECIKNSQANEDIVVKLIDKIIALKNLGKLQVLELGKLLPEIIAQKYSDQLILSPGFTQMFIAKSAMIEFKYLSLNAKKNALRKFFHVFDQGTTTFQSGSGPEINILLGSAYAYSNILLNDVMTAMTIFSIINPKMGNKFQFKRVIEDIHTNQQAHGKSAVIVLKYPEGFPPNELKEILARAIWLQRFGGIKQGRPEKVINHLTSLKPGEDIIAKVIREESIAPSGRSLPTISIMNAQNQAEPIDAIAVQAFSLVPGASAAIQRSGLFPASVPPTDKDNKQALQGYLPKSPAPH